MSIPVGRRTDITSAVVKTTKPWARLVVEQDWWLHPTKGWKKGQKRKRFEPIKVTKRWRPQVEFKQVWR